MASEDRIYALPAVMGGGFDKLEDLLHSGQQPSDPARGTIVDDSVGMMDEHSLSLNSDSPSCRLHVFRVLHFAPQRQKIMKSALCTLQSDHIAVAMFDIEMLDWESRSGTVSSGLRDKLDISGIRVLGLKQFLNLGPRRILNGLLQCQLCPSMTYTFRGAARTKTNKKKHTMKL